MNKKYAFFKNSIKYLVGHCPGGSLVNFIWETMDECVDGEENERSQRDNREAHQKLAKMMEEIFDRIDYMEKNGCESAQYVDFDFNRALSQEEVKAFSKFLCDDSDIPLDYAEMKHYPEDHDGITIDMQEEISGYDIQKAKQVMNELLKEVADDLYVENVEYWSDEVLE